MLAPTALRPSAAAPPTPCPNCPVGSRVQFAERATTFPAWSASLVLDRRADRARVDPVGRELRADGGYSLLEKQKSNQLNKSTQFSEALNFTFSKRLV